MKQQYKRVASLVVSNTGAEEEEEEEEECPICLEVFREGEELAASGCGHYFHTHCVKEWVQVDSREHHCQIRCPVCRFDVLDGVGAPTPAQIKHMRPQPVADDDLVEVDLEAGGGDLEVQKQ